MASVKPPSPSQSQRPNVAVIGGGITGLNAAWRLNQAGYQVELFDPAPRLGGAVSTRKKGSYLWEEGPNSLMVRNQELADLISNLGLSSSCIKPPPEASTRYLAWGGKIHALAPSPLTLLKTRLFSFSAKFGLLKEPFRRKFYRPDESVDAFFRRRLGDQWAERAVSAFIHGIYAGDSERLLVDYTFPFLLDAEEQSGSLIRHLFKKKKKKEGADSKPEIQGLVSFDEGLEVLTQTLWEQSKANWHQTTPSEIISTPEGWRLHWKEEVDGWEVEQFQNYRDVICAVPLNRLASLPLPPEIKDRIQRFPSLPQAGVVVQTIAFSKSDCPHPLDGFGFLIPAGEEQKVLGVLFSSSLFPGRCPDDQVLLTVFLGGMRYPEVARATEQERLDLSSEALRVYLGIEAAPKFLEERIWRDGIPQRMEPLPFILDSIQAIEKSWPGLHFLGNYRKGPGLPDCLTSSIEVIKKIQADDRSRGKCTDHLTINDLSPAPRRRHEFFMKLAIEEAAKAKGSTHPNPMVGALLVKDGEIIARAHHKRAGDWHAERLLLAGLKRPVPKGSVLYVTLEPCSTHGRTPPCLDIILDERVQTVVVGTTDPNPRHRGAGLTALVKAGVTVISGVLQEECASLNPDFNERMSKL